LLTLKKERRLRVIKNRMLRRIGGPNRDEEIGECGKLPNEKPNNPYSSSYLFG